MSRGADGTKRRRIALGRVHSFGVLLVLAFMLMWSKADVVTARSLGIWSAAHASADLDCKGDSKCK